MSIILDQLTQILAKAGISSSQEEEILIAAKDVITPPEATKEETIFEEACISNEEYLCEHEIEEDEEGISGDQNYKEHHANESCIKHRFEVSTSLNQFCSCFYFIHLHFQHSIFYIIVHVRFYFANSNTNLCVLWLQEWLHWKFHYT
jgi:hypothetical protein